MKYDGKNERDRRARELQAMKREVGEEHGAESEDHHLVFDFTEVHTADFQDLALILTARLASPPGESVWVRGIQPRTAMILRALGLDHLFRHYPGSETMH